jgi:hypothetical protein
MMKQESNAALVERLLEYLGCLQFEKCNELLEQHHNTFQDDHQSSECILLLKRLIMCEHLYYHTCYWANETEV